MNFFKKNIALTISIISFLISLLIFLITILIDSSYLNSRFISGMIEAMFIPFIYPIIGYIFKTKLPITLQIIITLHILIASIVGTAYNVYVYISCFDLILHGFFGFEAILILFLLMIKTKSTNISLPFFILLMLIFPVGCGAMWEMVEFTVDSITGIDCMHVYDAMEEGINPVLDTMTDMIVTLVVSIITLILFLIDKHFQYKVTKKIYLDFSNNIDKKEQNKTGL